MDLPQNLLKTETLGKSITIISLNYYPEDTAIGLYSTQMAEYLQLNNWEVTVVTGFPYYPQWKIEDSYSGNGKFLEETINNVRVLRYKQFVPSKPTFIKRILHIIDFTIGSKSNINKIKKSKIVLSVIPFTSSAWLGTKLSKRLNAKHWIHIQDFEFDIALESGITPNSGINKYLSNRLSKFESSILNSADIVSTISFGMMDRLKTKCSTKSIYFPNWIDPNYIDPKKAKKHSILKSKKFKVLYSGNIGKKQDWNLFLKVINHFKNNNQIEFYIVGDGSFKDQLIEKMEELDNVYLFPPVPYEELNDLLCSADLHFLFQKDDVIDSVMPSKILGMLASNVPTLVTGNINSEIAKIINTNKIGYFYSAKENHALLKKIHKLSSLVFQNEKMVENARNFIIETFSKESVLDTFISNLDELYEN